MSVVYNIYCDESCHLLNDHQGIMVLGAVWCPKDEARQTAERMREIKVRHQLKPNFEVKWSKVSPGKAAFYMDMADYFFDCKELCFRALLVPDKDKLRHEEFGQTHDDWYYKMYFTMLKQILRPSDKYHIYIDIKDTRGAEKIRKLHEVICNSLYDFSKSIVASIQLVHSWEVEQVQLADLLIGAVTSANRQNCSSSGAKLALVERIRKRAGYSLQHTTLIKEEKFNILRWKATEDHDE